MFSRQYRNPFSAATDFDDVDPVLLKRADNLSFLFV